MLEIFEQNFMRYALISMLLLGPACALMGVFITLRGMSFFSDAIAHSAITGLALSYIIQDLWFPHLPQQLTVLIFSLLLASLMATLLSHSILKPDTIIAFSLTGSVALGIIIIQIHGNIRLIENILFGDIYSNTLTDLLLQSIMLLGILLFISIYARPFLLLIIQPEVAKVRGINIPRMNLLFALLIATIVTLCLKMLGALLLTAIIVIPATTARLLAKSFRHMLLLAASLGIIGGVLGVILSGLLDTTTGPTIVLTHILILLSILILRALRLIPR